MSALVTSITGIKNLTALRVFNADYNGFTSVDLSNMTSLIVVDVSDSELPSDTSVASLTSINVTGCSALEELRLDDSDFSGGIPDLTGLPNLRWIDLDDCEISGSVDLSGLPALRGFDLSQNPGLTEIIISATQPLGDGESVDAEDCSLTQAAVDGLLVALSTNGISGGYVDLRGEGNSIPSATGLAAKAVLEENGWVIDVNSLD